MRWNWKNLFRRHVELFIEVLPCEPGLETGWHHITCDRLTGKMTSTFECMPSNRSCPCWSDLDMISEGSEVPLGMMPEKQADSIMRDAKYMLSRMKDTDRIRVKQEIAEAIARNEEQESNRENTNDG